MDNFNIRTKSLINSIAPNLFHKIVENEYNGNKCLEFTIRNGDKEIILGTENDEYSVFFSTYHCHFTPSDEVDEVVILKKAITFILELLDEKKKIVTYYEGENTIMGSAIDSSVIPEISTDLDIVLESWFDTYSTTILSRNHSVSN